MFDAFERRACGLIHMQFKVAEMERELYIAKQALEEISFGVCAKTKAGGCAQIELGKLQMQEIADMALTTLNTLSA